VAGNESTALFKGPTADAAAVARYGYRSMLGGKTIAIPGLKNRLSLESLRASPRSVVRVLAGRLNKP
jgi:short-subunit dehydrogenase